QNLQQVISSHWEESKPPKLSRGENYHQQAYRVMDFPRMQDGESFFLFRSLVLWGHPIGFHLIVSGHFMERLASTFLQHHRDLAAHWYYSQQEEPWIWEAEAPGLIPCAAIETSVLRIAVQKRSFFKLSSFLPLQQYQELPAMSLARWQELSAILSPFHGTRV
ncbi:MAG: hypothetical protein AAFQ68_05495, partial [Bacteroidota bacterium]